MTKEEIEKSAKEYAIKNYDYDVEDSRDGDLQAMRESITHHNAIRNFKEGANFVITSKEYLEMQKKAENWDNYQEECKSLIKKLQDRLDSTPGTGEMIDGDY